MIRLLIILAVAVLFVEQAAAQKRIDQLSPGSTLTGTETVPLCQGCSASTDAVSATLNNIKTFVGGSSGVSSINGVTGAITLGYGLSINTPLIDYDIAPWYPVVPNGQLSQTTGSANVLRDASMASWTHYNYMTQNNSGAHPYNNGIASFTGSISGTTLTASSVTGTIQPFQRLTDPVTLTTNAATAAVASALGIPTTCGSSPTACVLHFASGPPATILVGMHAEDLTSGHEKAIPGNATVGSVDTTAHTVTLTQPVGYSDDSQRNSLGAGVVSGDTIAFSMVKRGTMILQQLTGTTGGAGTYQLSVSQTVASETMQSAGGWAAEGVYVIPVGAAGSSNYVTCQPGSQSNGSFTPINIQCIPTGTLTDLIFRFPIDSVDAARVNCSVYTGNFFNCVSALITLQPITFQIWATFDPNTPGIPSLNSKISCPLYPGSLAGANLCLDDWTNATMDLAPVTLPPCNTTAPTPDTCSWTYIWKPTGIAGNMEIEFHAGALSTGKNIIINAFELKQTPGATCAGTAPPCSLLYGVPIELPLVSADIEWNKRFAQALGTGTQAGWNVGGLGATETTAGYATSTTNFRASWPLQRTLKCDVWQNGTKNAATCPVPVFYSNNPGNYQFWTNAAQFIATGISVANLGLNSIQLDGTTTGLTATAAGYVTWTNHESFVDSSYTSFGD